MTDERLAELEGLAAAATPGPWRVGVPVWHCTLHAVPHPGPEDGCVYTYEGWENDRCWSVSPDPGYGPADTSDAERPVVCGMWDYDAGGVRRPADALFIAAARGAVPELVAEVRRLRAELARVREGGGV